MTQENPKRRKRGIVLTAKGQQKLQTSIRQAEQDENFSEKYTLEDLSDRTGLDPGTVAKVLDAEEGADRRTLERFFRTFDLTLEESDYRKPGLGKPETQTKDESTPSTIPNRVDWGEAVDVSIFYGRTTELEILERWIIHDRCRLVALLGMGGIGKTSLTAKLGEQIQEHFEYVVWRSLREAPPLQEILTSLIQFLSDQQVTKADLPDSIGGCITKLVEYLRNHRCLLILDNAESILQEGLAGVYREGYEGYGEMLKRIGESAHQSCLALTSREKPRELSAMGGETLPVRSLQLRGMESIDGQEILKAKGLLMSGLEAQGNELIQRCAGNPLALKLVATTIRELFDGDIADFLAQDAIAFDGVRILLDQHFDRLSEVERSVMYWLAINREPMTVQELQEDIIPATSKSKLLEALNALVGRSLIERTANCFTQQPVIMEYVTEHLIDQSNEEIKIGSVSILNQFALMKATTKDYVRETQARLILDKVINHSSIVGENSLTTRSSRILSVLRENKQPGYATGNILNLLCRSGTDLTDYDFSELTIWQGYLQHTNLHGVNFSGCEISKTVFSKAFGSVRCVAFSPDGKTLATCDTNGQICLWQVSDGKQLLSFRGHDGWGLSVAFHPDGTILATSSTEICLWDTATGKHLRTLNEHTKWVRSIDFSPDGKTLASGSYDETIKLWDIETGQCIKVLQRQKEGIVSIAFSPDGKKLAGGAGDRTITIWGVDDGQPLYTLTAHAGEVRSLTWSEDGLTLASASGDQTIRIWREQQCNKVLRGHTNMVRSVKFSPDGQILASASEDQTIKLWSVDTGECIKTLVGHLQRVDSISFSPDGQTLASGSYDQTIKLWSVGTGECLESFQGYTNWTWALSFSPNGQYFVSGSDDSILRIWDVSTSRCIRTLQGHSGWIWSTTFSPDGKLLASTSEDKTVRVWDTKTARCLKILRGHTHRVRSVTFSPDGQTLASCGADRTIKLWDLSSSLCIRTLKGHTRSVQVIGFSCDGQILASSSYDHTIKLWNSATGECIRTLNGHTKELLSAVFSSDGKLLITGSSDQYIRIWEITTGQCTCVLEGHSAEVQSLALVPNSDLLISGGIDCTLRLWNITTGQCLRVLKEHPRPVLSVTCSPNGQFLVSSSQDEEIRLWEIATGECIQVLKIPRPYEGMNITGVTGIYEAQKVSLFALGASESD